MVGPFEGSFLRIMHGRPFEGIFTRNAWWALWEKFSTCNAWWALWGKFLGVMYSGPFEGSIIIHGTDGRQFLSIYVKIYIPRYFQGGGQMPPLPPCGRACYIHAFMERSKQYAFQKYLFYYYSQSSSKSSGDNFYNILL